VPGGNRHASRSGNRGKHRLPLTPPDAFRCSHWLATMAFLNVERTHLQSVNSFVKATWQGLSKFTLKHEKTSIAATLGVSIALGGASFAISTGVGAATGSVVPVIGTIIGSVVGAVVGAASAIVSICAGVAISLAQHRHCSGRKKMFDRLTNSRHDHRKDMRARYQRDPEDETGHWYVVTEEGESIGHVARRYTQHEVSFVDIWFHEKNGHLKDMWHQCKDPRVSQADTELAIDTKVWIPVPPGSDLYLTGGAAELFNLTYTVQHTLRDAVVHIRHALDIHREMAVSADGLMEGLYYVPSPDETYDDLKKNLKERYPELDLDVDEVLNHSKNEPFSTWHTPREDETLQSISEQYECNWWDILEHKRNARLREFYRSKNLDPQERGTRSGSVLTAIDMIYIPLGIPREARPVRYRLLRAGNRMHVVTQRKTAYLNPARKIWIQLCQKLDAESFDSCRDMIGRCKPAMSFVHHLNKARNYVLPALNLCATYVEIFEELKGYAAESKAVVEGAVSDYMKRGDHAKCALSYEFRKLYNDYNRIKAGAGKTSPVAYHLKRTLYIRDLIHLATKKMPIHKCMRNALQKVKQSSDAPVVYTAAEGDTFPSVAAAHGVPVQALISHNFEKNRIGREEVRFDSENGKWDIQEATIGAGTQLEIPPKNRLDKMMYGPALEKANLRNVVSGDFDSLAAKNQANFFSQISIVECDITQLKADLDEIISDYHAALKKNRDRHNQKWNQARGAERRFHHFTTDILNVYDMFYWDQLGRTGKRRYKAKTKAANYRAQRDEWYEYLNPVAAARDLKKQAGLLREIASAEFKDWWEWMSRKAGKDLRVVMSRLKDRLPHGFSNEWMRTTRAEKTNFVTTSCVSVAAGGISGAASPWINYGVTHGLGFDKGASYIFKSGFEWMKHIKKPEHVPLAGVLYMVDMQQQVGGIAGREGITKGASTAWSLAKAATNKIIVPKIVNSAYEGGVKGGITNAQLLDFRRERLLFAAHWSQKRDLKDREKALKEAAKEIEQLFPKIARHAVNCWNVYINKLLPRVEALKEKEGEVGCGLTGCRDSYFHLRDLYEFQHELDKAERYLMPAISMVLHLRAWESHLSEIEEDLWQTLEDSAAQFIAGDNHANCRDRYNFKKGCCYGPSEDSEHEALAPLWERPPRTPDKGEPQLARRIVTDGPGDGYRSKRGDALPPRPPTKPLPRPPRRRVPPPPNKPLPVRTH